MKIITDLNELHLDTLKIKKFREHSNTLYHDKRNYQYITIYNKPLDLYFLFQENPEFVKEFIPALKNLIIEKKNNKILLKGYIMKEGRRLITPEHRVFIEHNKQKIIDFVKQTKYYYWDMTARNAIYLKEEDKISLIDLESFKSLRVKKKNRNVKITGYVPDWYRETCESLKYYE